MRVVAGFLTGGAGAWAFVYAHDHDPTPGADPMAVRLLSHTAYGWLHYGGLALIVIGAVLVLWAIQRWFVASRP